MNRRPVMNTRAHAWFALLFVLLTPLSARAQGAAASWSGLYVGGHAGSAWHDISYVELDDPDAAISPSTMGPAGGVLAGYARPLTHFVIGMEFDAGTASAHVTSDDPGNDYSAFELGWNSHLRGRLAYPRGRVAPFFAAGLAALRMRSDDVDDDFGEGTATHVGWSVGGGVDAAVTSRFAIRAEFLHDDYNTARHAITAPAGPFFPAYKIEVTSRSNVLRAAVLYRF